MRSRERRRVRATRRRLAIAPPSGSRIMVHRAPNNSPRTANQPPKGPNNPLRSPKNPPRTPNNTPEPPKNAPMAPNDAPEAKTSRDNGRAFCRCTSQRGASAVTEVLPSPRNSSDTQRRAQTRRRNGKGAYPLFRRLVAEGGFLGRRRSRQER